MDMSMAQYASDLIYDKSGKRVDPKILWGAMVHETGNFSSELSPYHNYGGVKTTEDTGLPVPENEREPEGGLNFYKKYDSDEEFVDDWTNTVASYMADADHDDITTPEDYVHWLTQGKLKYFTDDPQVYINGIYNGEGDIDTNVIGHVGPWGTTKPFSISPEPEVKKHYSFMDEFTDKFTNSFVDNGIVSVLRTAWANFTSASSLGDLPFVNDYTPSQEDIKLVQDTLDGDTAAQQYVLTQSSSREALLDLLAMKKADRERQQRVDSMDYGLSTFGTIVGSIMDPAMILSLIPGIGQVSGAAKAASLISKITKARAMMQMGSAAINSSKLAKYGIAAAKGVGIVGADRYAAEHYGGFKVDYGTSMALGGVLGGLGVYLRRFRNNPVAKQVAKKADQVEDDTVAIATGDTPKAEVSVNTKRTLAQMMRDEDTAPEVLKAEGDKFKGDLAKSQSRSKSIAELAPEGSLADTFIKRGELYIISKKAARKIADAYGIKLAKNAKAFSIPKLNVSVIFKDKVDKDTINGVVLHEVGVHTSLNKLMPKDEYNKLMAKVSDRMEHSNDQRWINARRNADSPEEALAYWIEQGASRKNSIIRGIIKNVAANLYKGQKIDKELEETVYNIIRENAKLSIANSSPVTKMADGSKIIDDVHYSKDNVLATIFDLWDDKGAGSQARQSRLTKRFGRLFGGYLGRKMEAGTFFGNIYGTMANSHSKKMQAAARLLFHDPRMEARSSSEAMPAERIKGFLTDRWNSAYINFINARTAYINKTFGFGNLLRRNHLINKVNEDIIKCHDAMVSNKTLDIEKYPAEIKAMAKQIMDLRADIITQLKKDSEALGGRKGLGSVIEKDWEPLSNGFYRIVNNDKRAQWAAKNFKTEAEEKDFLKKYARTFMDVEAETKYFLTQHKKEYDKMVKAYTGDPKDLPAYKPPTDKEIGEFLDKEALDWATGMTDREASLMSFDGPMHKVSSGAIQNFKHRVAMDTSGVMKMKNGIDFSFDNDLRNYDMDSYVPQLINRMSGEAALQATIGGKVKQQNFLDEIAQDIAKNDTLRKASGAREQDALRLGIEKILGIGSYNLYDQKWGDAVSNMLRSWSYANVGGNMTFAQLGELGGSIAYGGFKVIADNIPFIRNIAQEMRIGKTGQEAVRNALRGMYAEDIATKGWDMTTSTDSRVFREMMDRENKGVPVPVVGARALDATNRIAKRAALITSTINFMPKLTNLMVKSMRQSVIEDSLRWASGEKVGGLFRNPFSVRKMEAIGINNDKDMEAIRQACKKYLVDGKGNVDKWMDEDPISFFRWKQLVDNQSMRGIQQQSIGNMNPFKERHRLLFQFKDFALKAVNGQFMRAMSNRERDDIMAALYSMATNAASYYGLTVARSYALYPNDEEKRKEFMERQANPERLALAGFMRMSLLAPLSFASDAIEATTGTPMFRTTVDNSMRPKDPDWSTYSIGQRVGKGLSEQLPAVATAVRTAGAMTAGASLMTGNGTQKDIDDALRGLPLGTWYGLIAAGSLIKGDSTLPENKREAKKSQTAKNPLMQISGNNKTQKKSKKTKVSNPMMSLTPKKNNKESLLDQLKG